MSKHATPQAQTEQEQSTHPPEAAQKQPASSPASANLQALQGLAGNSAVSQLLEGRTADGSAAAAQDGLRTPGQKLEPTLRTEMETRFGEDFGDVQVHTDAASAQALDARAYTVGQDIVLGGEEDLSTSATGKQLLAHELTHVVQQSSGVVGNGGSTMRVNAPGDQFEQEADSVAKTVTSVASTPAVQRQMPEEELQAKRLQRQELEDEDVQLQEMPEDDEGIQMQALPEEDKLTG